MSRYNTATEQDLWRGFVVAEFGPEDVGLEEYLRARSPADDGREVLER